MERKLLTILFVDIVDSTGLVTSSDPEVARRRVERFVGQVRDCVEAHGGRLGKYTGDAVMAAFGFPVTHEDDAERAICAGLRILEGVGDLQLEARIGVESGEVVSDEDDFTFATGEAINVAVRLQQEAAPGELLVGPGARRLTDGRFDLDERGLLSLRGIERPVPAWRVLAQAAGDGKVVRLNAPLVGREVELELLENTWERVLRARRAHLFTMYGEPGVGKSRLAQEFASALEGATVLAGRALPYGEGITYWPLAEMVKVSAGISDDDPVREAVDKLRACCEDEAVADLLALASGVLELVEEERSAQEIAWAAREWAEKLAQAQPLILVFEDIHWAEDPLLELIEHLAEWVREAPLLILCLARPELLEQRPDWGGGRLRATAIELEPLSDEESRDLVEALARDDGLPDDTRVALLKKSGGNPLFLEETVRMLAEEGDEAIARIPDTVQALIAARIDRLPPAEKAVLQRAAVIGREFWAGAVERMSPELENLEAVFEHLLLRDFIVPSPRARISGQTAYRFKHVLIREVAYSGLTKSARARLHRDFAAWLDENAGDELLEIRAYHLDHGYTLLAELDGEGPAELAVEAAAALEQAGRRALAREANRVARRLFLRSLELEPTLKRRFEAARAAWRTSDYPVVSREMEEVCAAAEAEGANGIQGRALTALADAAIARDADIPRAEELIDRALDVLDQQDKVARFDALAVRTTITWARGDLTTEEQVLEEMLALARAAGRKDLESEAADTLASVYIARLDLDRAKELADRALALAEESGSAAAIGRAYRFLGQLHLACGELDEAEAALEPALTNLSEAGAAWAVGRTLAYSAWVAWRKGDEQKAERLFRESIRTLAPLEDRSTLCESQRGLAQLLVEQGKVPEAERLALEARQTVGPQDATSQATTTVALGVVRAAQGRDAEAEQLLRAAYDGISETEHRRTQLEVLEALTAFLRERGRTDEAEPYEHRLAELSRSAPQLTA